MTCPICRHAETRVFDSRQIDGATRRRRECLQCLHRWTTFELAEARVLHLERLEQQARTIAEMVGE